MSMGYPEIAALCRAVSVNKLNEYVACCDYYGTLDEVHILVSDCGFNNHSKCKINALIKLSGDEVDSALTLSVIESLNKLNS